MAWIWGSSSVWLERKESHWSIRRPGSAETFKSADEVRFCSLTLSHDCGTDSRESDDQLSLMLELPHRDRRDVPIELTKSAQYSGRHEQGIYSLVTRLLGAQSHILGQGGGSTREGEKIRSL